MIPKKIHYCWFGKSEKPKSVVKCIDSWGKYCSDYEIIEWNESNIDLDIMPFVREAYDNKKYAFVSDVIRLWVLYNYGGIYFDTDVEVLKSFDNFLIYEGFIGFETDNFVNTGQGVGAEKGNQIIKEMLDYYSDLHFVNLDGSLNKIGCPKVNTKILEQHGLKRNGKKQVIENFVVFPKDFFNPYDDPNGILKITDNTYSIHWYSKTWMSKKTIFRSKITRQIRRLLRFFKI